MTWVKICGITNLEDAKVAVDAGADALGFVFYRKSARNVSAETVKKIVWELPPKVEKVGVFVGQYPEDLADLIRAGNLTALQFHWNTGLALTSGDKASGIASGLRTYLSMPAELFVEHQDTARGFISSLERFSEDARSLPKAVRLFETIFLDSGTLQQPGGTGTAFDWQKAAPVVEQLKLSVKVVVAGGLTPDNVTHAMGILKPWGVDVSSGVEASPGKKDPGKVRAFVAAVRRADAGK